MKLQMYCNSASAPVAPYLYAFGERLELPTNDFISRYMALATRARDYDSTRAPNQIQFMSYWSTADGFGQSANLFARGLHEAKVVMELKGGIGLNAIEQSKHSVISEIQARRAKVRKFDPDVAFTFVIPPDAFFAPDAKRIVGMTMWESDRLPESLVSVWKTFDQVLVPTRFCQQIFAEAGLKTHLVPLPLNPVFYRDWTPPATGPFTFLFISSPVYRKGVDILIRCFQKAFPDNPDVRLRMHTRRWFPGESVIEADMRKLIGDDKRIVRSHKTLSDWQLMKLHNSAHVFVHPSMGEGFGLTPLQAMAMGMPTIYTNATGMADFADELGVGIPVEMSHWEVPRDPYFLKFPQGYFAHIDEDKLIAEMRALVNDEDIYDRNCRECRQYDAQRIRKYFSYRRLSEYLRRVLLCQHTGSYDDFYHDTHLMKRYDVTEGVLE